ncbi:MAG: hypothetical protein PHC34_02490 [Candidatus Gastranaerophilales bacterium]|nr:hypothetical protein [Candidatus Gastranaerophilales bacterium]
MCSIKEELEKLVECEGKFIQSCPELIEEIKTNKDKLKKYTNIDPDKWIQQLESNCNVAQKCVNTLKEKLDKLKTNGSF